MQVLQLQGFPFETASDEELNYRKTVRETLLRGAASSRLAIYHHVVRRRVTAEWTQEPVNPFCRHLDGAWRARLAERNLYVNEIFLTLVRRPLQGGAGFLERLIKRPGTDALSEERALRQLNATREAFVSALAPYGARTLSLYDGAHGLCSEPAEFLSLLVNSETRPVLAPSGDLGNALATRRLNFGFDAMEFAAAGAHAPVFGAMVSLKDYPLRSAPGMLDGTLRLPFEMVLTESFGFVDNQSALNRMSLALRRLSAADDDALSLRGELAAAKDDVGAGRTAYGEHHLSILVKSESLDGVDAAVADVQSALAETGAIAVREGRQSRTRLLGAVPRQFHPHRAQGADLHRELREPGELPQSPAGPSGARPLGRAHHGARDHRVRALSLQFPQRRSRQFHRHRGRAARARPRCSPSFSRRPRRSSRALPISTRTAAPRASSAPSAGATT